MRAAGQRWVASSKQHRERRRRGVYTSDTAVSAAVSAAQVGVSFRHEPTLHSLFFQAAQARWPIRTGILFTSVRFPFPMFGSTCVNSTVSLCYAYCLCLNFKAFESRLIYNWHFPVHTVQVLRINFKKIIVFVIILVREPPKFVVCL